MDILLRWSWRWNVLVDILVRPVQVEVSDVFLHNMVEMTLAKNKEAVEAFMSKIHQPHPWLPDLFSR